MCEVTTICLCYSKCGHDIERDHYTKCGRPKWPRFYGEATCRGSSYATRFDGGSERVRDYCQGCKKSAASRYTGYGYSGYKYSGYKYSSYEYPSYKYADYGYSGYRYSDYKYTNYRSHTRGVGGLSRPSYSASRRFWA